MKKIMGFSLAELLVAMTVMGFIAALSIPVLTKNTSPDNNAMMMKKTFKTLSDGIEELINSPSYPGYDGVCPSDGEMDTFGLGCMVGSGANSNTQKLPCLFTQLINTNERYTVSTDSNGNVTCTYGSNDIDTASIIADGTTATSHYRITSADKMQWYFPVANGFVRAASEQARNSSIIVVVDVNGAKVPNCIPTQIGSAAGCNNESVDRMRFRVWADGQIEVIDDIILSKLETGHITKEQH